MKLNTELAATILEKHGLTVEAKLIRECVLDLGSGRDSQLLISVNGHEGYSVRGVVQKITFPLIEHRYIQCFDRYVLDPPPQIDLSLSFFLPRHEKVFLTTP